MVLNPLLPYVMRRRRRPLVVGSRLARLQNWPPPRARRHRRYLGEQIAMY